MIQVLDVLGKKYKDLKEYIIRNDFDEKTLKDFAGAGIVPPLSDAKLNDELYFYDFKVEKHKIVFSHDEVREMICMLSEADTRNLIKKLITRDFLIFRFYPNEQLQNTEWMDKENSSEEGFLSWKVETFAFDKSSAFDVDHLEKYGLITFQSEDFTIMVKNYFFEDKMQYLFELEPNIKTTF
ncbi:hypothetical protein N0B40_04935 [Chryseobacterium oranimense]|uniref:hypothetical protein n=1 Tax=Chryseobacterium oranimense TaxID=421058 RepID=UPI0021AFBFE0|nr:hypothetical protein [Chryseobacterium oranimense]UWX61624.1 hypothetical protein N0B40_04935 [Chryseobacterium oranimense]